LHVHDVITQDVGVDIPWDDFTTEFII